MKRVLLLSVILSVAFLAGCAKKNNFPEITSDLCSVSVSEEEPKISVNEEKTSAICETDSTSETFSVRETQDGTCKSDVEISVTASDVELSTEEASEKNTTAVDLSISMPQKNGTMKTDVSPDNKFISAVHNKRKINKALLAAVFSVPESGQNYVFEFKNVNHRRAKDLRRVYLLDQDLNIVSVAAALDNEKERISSIENWFSMNVLIKEVIFPAIEDELGG